MNLQPGDIYHAKFGQGKARPVVVVSRANLNSGKYVIVVPFTTQRLDKRRTLDSCEFFKSGEHGLTEDCVAKADEITFIDKISIDSRKGRLGALPKDRMTDIVKAIRYVVNDDID